MSDASSLSASSMPQPPRQKSVALAFLFSLVVPGSGQLYCRRWKAGFLTLLFFVVSAGGLVALWLLPPDAAMDPTYVLAGVLLRTAIVLFGFSFLDAVHTAREITRGEDRTQRYNPRAAAVLNLLTGGFGYLRLGEKKRGWTVLLLAGILSRANRRLENIWLDLGLEGLLIGLAVDGYRLAQKKNPQEEVGMAPPEAERREVVATLAHTLAALLVAGYFGLVTWGQLSPDYDKIDQAQAPFQASAAGSAYRNAKYGVSLRLPGNWTRQEASPNDFCVLTDEEESLSVVLTAAAVFPMTTADDYAAAFVEQMSTLKGRTILSNDPLQANGHPARRILMTIQDEDTQIRQATLIVKKGLSVFVLILSAPSAAEERWREMAGHLPEAIQIE